LDEEVEITQGSVLHSGVPTVALSQDGPLSESRMFDTALNGQSGSARASSAAVDSLRVLPLVPGAAFLFKPFFETFNPSRYASELAALEAKLLRENSFVPLIVRRGHNLLLDGYNRHRLCTRHGFSYASSRLS
jgi:hypothetical protein